MATIEISSFKSLITDNSWTAAFQKAIDTLEAGGGGTLYVPSGKYITGSIVLKSNITFYLESGAQLFFEDELEKYPIIELSYIGKPLPMFRPLIYARDAENIVITGGGTLDGNGKRWWGLKEVLRKNGYRRPHMICFEQCKNIRIEGIQCINSPAWTIHPLRCENVQIHGVSIKNPADSPNTDGINPNSSRNVRITSCRIDVGDDCIAIKAGTEDSIDPGICENIIISDCNMIHGHGGIVIGSEMSGTVRNVTVNNCVFQETDRGIRLKTRRRRGGKMEFLSFQNIIMDRVLCPIVANMYYYCGERGKEKYVWDKSRYPVDETTPQIRDVRISNVVAYHVSAAAGFFYGLAEMPIENISISHCAVYMEPDGEEGLPAMMGHMPMMKQAGFYLRNVKDIIFHDVKIHNVTGDEIDTDETADFIQE